MSYLICGDDADPSAPLGGKARALAALRQADLPIPPWVALTPEALYASLGVDGRQRLQGSYAEEVRALVGQLQPAPEVRTELERALAALCPNRELVAVRSSASDEDGVQHSFAGQLDSFLAVPPADVARAAAAVWRSGFGERVLAYRKEHDLPLVPAAPAVLIQRMVNADAAGVAFGADPVSGRRGVAVVAAVCGLGTALVSGEGDADTYHVDRDGRILDREIAVKRFAHRPAPGTAEGFRVEPVPEEKARQPALDDDQVRAVADLARRTGRFFGRPQDIEWAIESGRLYLLQSRPIT
jgi:pyruvate,water dikinase